MQATELDSYLNLYGPLLAAHAQERFDPLHVPGRDPLPEFHLHRRPFPAQAEAIAGMVAALKRQKSVLLCAEMGTGKAQPLDAKVLTPYGWVRMGEMKPGDAVIDPGGGVARVLDVYPQGVKPIYRVTFSDGSSTECCGEHLWLVITPERKWRTQPGFTATTDELRNRGLTNRRGNARYFIPLVAPVHFRMPDDLPLEPYLLGLLLGDGGLTTRTPTFTTADRELADAVAAMLPVGIAARKIARDKYGFRLSGEKWKPSRLYVALMELGLAGLSSREKFIPQQYLRSVPAVRLAVLQGLLDTDGSVSRGYGIEYATTSHQLAIDVQELVRSLGGLASVKLRHTTCRHKGRKTTCESYRLYITLPAGYPPFRLVRKASKYHRAGKYGPTRAIVSIEPAGSKECRCILVSSPSHTYVTDDYIVTHNTLMGAAALAACAKARGNRPYRALVFCPGQLVDKWAREIKSTIPRAFCASLENWREVHALWAGRNRNPSGAEWYVIGRDRAKLGAKWMPSYLALKADRAYLYCPTCLQRLTHEKKEGAAVGLNELKASRKYCQAMTRTLDPATGEERHVKCGAPLWQWTHELDRWSPATFIHKKLKGFFDYLILDELHEEKGEDTLQGNAAGSLAAACRKVIGLTGTICGGKAEDMRTLLFRLSPSTLVAEGLAWSDATEFNERYGRVEKVVSNTSDADCGTARRQGRGSDRTSTYKKVRPGIMPTLFGRHLIGNTVFLGLNEVAAGLPKIKETEQDRCGPIAVPMDPMLEAAYRPVEDELRSAVKEMLCKSHGKDKRLLGAMLMCLLAYPDYPFDWGPIGYMSEEGYVPVVQPHNLPWEHTYAKERELLRIIRHEIRERRKCWVYCQFTDKRDVMARLERYLQAQGFRVSVLRSQAQGGPKVVDREKWIAEKAPKSDVIISFPKLVETGLDFFQTGGDHQYLYNIPTIIFYETGYNIFTLRQASRRAWRIGQREDCKVFYLYYQNTMQQTAMTLIAKKLLAALALEGRFSTEGLAAMGGDDNMEMAMAKALAERIEDHSLRDWDRLSVNDRAEETLDDDTLATLAAAHEFLAGYAGMGTDDDPLAGSAAVPTGAEEVFDAWEFLASAM